MLANTPNDDGGHLTVFTVDESGSVYRNIWHEPIVLLDRIWLGHWTGWEQLPMYGKRQIAVANNGENFTGGGRLELFAVDGSDSVQHVWQTKTTDESSWGGPANRYGNVRAIIAGHNPDGRIEIFGMKADHRVMHDWENWSISTNWQY